MRVDHVVPSADPSARVLVSGGRDRRRHRARRPSLTARDDDVVLGRRLLADRVRQLCGHERRVGAARRRGRGARRHERKHQQDERSEDTRPAKASTLPDAMRVSATAAAPPEGTRSDFRRGCVTSLHRRTPSCVVLRTSGQSRSRRRHATDPGVQSNPSFGGIRPRRSENPRSGDGDPAHSGDGHPPFARASATLARDKCRRPRRHSSTWATESRRKRDHRLAAVAGAPGATGVVPGTTAFDAAECTLSRAAA